MYKDRGCGQVNLDNVDQIINVAGWVDSWRDHGSLLFLDLRDSTGTIQVVFDKSINNENHEIARLQSELRLVKSDLERCQIERDGLAGELRDV